eukprot:CAMPEP_0198429728 /NCGR_PEP_ID=MMETSP1452-20131203/9272_1 /TAXON_ID=1181717 /ORGANISM="Synchroma pusillum, Strain CCMP3072" /LENGTH=228 /DNA_ID=CAMNT_0044150145 /DNA_START=37 /DNA_END=721 /DNA_ORIENTATION=-
MAEEHGNPAEGMECMCCMEDITMNLYVEYCESEGAPWRPATFCRMCIEHLLSTQWNQYCDRLRMTKCKAEQRRLLTAGPPVNIKDPNAMPCGDDGEVFALWYGLDRQVHSAKLEGSLTGEAREKYWEEQRAFFVVDEPDDEEHSAAAAAPSPAADGTQADGASHMALHGSTKHVHVPARGSNVAAEARAHCVPFVPTHCSGRRTGAERKRARKATGGAPASADPLNPR